MHMRCDPDEFDEEMEFALTASVEDLEEQYFKDLFESWCEINVDQ